MGIKIDLKQVIIYVCLFLIFLYPFNSTIAPLIYRPFILSKVSILGSIFILYFLCYNFNGKIKKNQLISIFLFVLVMFFILINNIDIQRGNSSKTILLVMYLFLIPLFSKDVNLFGKTKNIIKLFGLEHIGATYFAVFFRGAYISYVLPYLDLLSPSYLPSRAFMNDGVNPGLTTHYSANGMYLSMITLFFFTEFLTSKNKKSLILFFLSIGALFITGKRGHALFTILACLIEYIMLKKQQFIKKTFTIVIMLLFGFFAFQIAASFIPSIATVFNRIVEMSNSSGDMLNGRDDLYSLALELWDHHRLFGSGWGAYSLFFQQSGYERLYGMSYLDAHNIYLQLLSEVGVVGLAFAIFIFVKCLVLSYKKCKHADVSQRNYFIYCFAFTYQLFFLMYGVTGNPLYDVPCYSMYFMCIGIALSDGSYKKGIEI